MNSRQLDRDIERKILLAQHISGSIGFVVNIIVFVLILMDDERRNKGFRKYITGMMLSSLILDSFSDLYSPIVLFNKGLIYSDSLLANAISAAGFFALFALLMTECVASYFNCVYYRWSIVLPEERWFNYRGWKRIGIHSFVQVSSILTISTSLYFYQQAMIASENSLPPSLQWVKSRVTYVFTVPDANVKSANYVIFPTITVIVLAVFTMLTQLVTEVKKGMRKASTATRRYQMMAIRSLILQGTVPSLIYLIPNMINTCYELDYCERDTQFATILSPILWIIITKHTFAVSMTILYCTPSYRDRIVYLCPSSICKWLGWSQLSRTSLSLANAEI